MIDYLMSVRAVANGAFTDEVGPTQYLFVPSGQDPAPAHAAPSQDAWYAAVLRSAAWENDNGEERGDILFIVHGYNISEADVIERHRLLRGDLESPGLAFKGAVVSFDWPSDNSALAYLSDRHKAKASALQLVTGGITSLSKKQTPACPINIHVLGHSTGAYVIREAFDDADDCNLANDAWNVSQVMFAAGDVSADSMAEGNGGGASIYRHCVRVTNYSNRLDEALGLSNVKRLGIAPRVGRMGLPADCPPQAVNVDCTAYYQVLVDPAANILHVDEPQGIEGMQSHSWYFGNKVFARDLFDVLIGTDRMVIKTRAADAAGNLVLVR